MIERIVDESMFDGISAEYRDGEIWGDWFLTREYSLDKPVLMDMVYEQIERSAKHNKWGDYIVCFRDYENTDTEEIARIAIKEGINTKEELEGGNPLPRGLAWKALVI